jgi:hypothetical protein
VNRFAPNGGTGGTTTNRFAAVAGSLAPPEESTHSPFGFVGNVVGGLSDLALGIGKLAVSPVLDIARAGLEGVSLGKIDLPGGYMTDDILKGFGSIPRDYWDRYSPLLPGGRPASQFMQELYDKPVSFGLDALAVGSLAGKAAGAAGLSKYAAESGLTGDALTALKKTFNEVPEGASLSQRTAKLANIRKALEGMEGGAPRYAKLLPEYRNVRVGNSVDHLTTTLRNPILRALQDVMETKLGSRSTLEKVEDFGARIEKQAEQFNAVPGTESVGEYIIRERKIYEDAKAAGMTRIQKPFESRMRADKRYTSFRNAANGTWFRDRMKDAVAWKKIWMNRVKNMDDEERAAAPYRETSTNMQIEGFADPKNEVTQRAVAASGRYAVAVELVDGEVPARVFDPEVHPPLVQGAKELSPDYQIEEALRGVDELDEIVDNLDPEELPVLDLDIAEQKEAIALIRDGFLDDIETFPDKDLTESGMALARAKDFVDRLEKLKTFYEDSPVGLGSRATRKMMDVNGISMNDWDAIAGLTLKEAKAAQDALRRNASEVGKIRREAQRVAASARTTSKATRRGEVEVGMGAAKPQLSRAQLKQLEQRRELLQGELDQIMGHPGIPLEQIGGPTKPVPLPDTPLPTKREIGQMRLRVEKMQQRLQNLRQREQKQAAAKERDARIKAEYDARKAKSAERTTKPAAELTAKERELEIARLATEQAQDAATREVGKGTISLDAVNEEGAGLGATLDERGQVGGVAARAPAPKRAAGVTGETLSRSARDLEHGDTIIFADGAEAVVVDTTKGFGAADNRISVTLKVTKAGGEYEVGDRIQTTFPHETVFSVRPEGMVAPKVQTQAEELHARYEAAVEAKQKFERELNAQYGKTSFAPATKQKAYRAKVKASGTAFSRVIDHLEKNKVPPPEGHAEWGTVKPTELREFIKRTPEAEAPEAVREMSDDVPEMPPEARTPAAPAAFEGGPVNTAADFAALTGYPITRARRIETGVEGGIASHGPADTWQFEKENGEISYAHVYQDEGLSRNARVGSVGGSTKALEKKAEKVDWQYDATAGNQRAAENRAAAEAKRVRDETAIDARQAEYRAADARRAAIDTSTANGVAAYLDDLNAGTKSMGTPYPGVARAKLVRKGKRPTGKDAGTFWEIELKDGRKGFVFFTDDPTKVTPRMQMVTDGTAIKGLLKKADDIEWEDVAPGDAAPAAAQVVDEAVPEAVPEAAAPTVPAAPKDPLSRAVYSVEDIPQLEMELATAQLDLAEAYKAIEDRTAAETAANAAKAEADATRTVHPLGDVPKNQRRVEKLQKDIERLNQRIEEGTSGPPKPALTGDAAVEQAVREQGGLLQEFLSPGGTKNRSPFLLAALAEDLRAVLGDELGAKILDGVTDIADLRKRLDRLQLDPTSLVGNAWKEVDKARRAAGLPAPGYFPMIDIDRISKADWVMRQPGTIAALRAVTDPNEKYDEGILFRKDRFLKDPLQARLIRSARHARADGTLRALEAVVQSKVGRVLEPGMHAAPDERIIPLEYLRGVNRISKEYYDARLKHLQAGMSQGDATLAAIDEVVRTIQDRIASGELDAGGMTMYAVPAHVATRMTDAARAAGIINGPFAKVYFQGPMNVWRSLVLAGSPRWIVNNVLGNVVFSIMQGAPVLRAFHILEQRFKRILNEKYNLKLKTAKLDELERRLKEAGFDDTNVLEAAEMSFNRIEADTQTYIPDIEQTGPGGRLLVNSRRLRALPKDKLTRGERALRKFQKTGDMVRAFNGEIESSFRMNSALTAAEQLAGIGRMKRMMGHFQRGDDKMNRIFRDGLTENQARQVVREMNHFLGDFGDLGPWERNIIRPYIAPFWGFYKHVGKLLLSYPFEYPERALILNGLANVTKDLQEKYGEMPGWLESAIPLGPPSKEVKFLTTAGPNPFSGLMQSPIGMLSPPLKMALEQLQGRDAFTGQRFSDVNTYNPYGTDQFYDLRTGEQRNAPRPSFLNQALDQIPQYDMLKKLFAGGQAYDTSSLLDAMRGQATIKDSETGETKFPSDIWDQLARLFGFPTTTYNLDKFQQSIEQGSEEAMREAMKREASGT